MIECEKKKKRFLERGYTNRLLWKKRYGIKFISKLKWWKYNREKNTENLLLWYLITIIIWQLNKNGVVSMLLMWDMCHVEKEKIICDSICPSFSVDMEKIEQLAMV